MLPIRPGHRRSHGIASTPVWPSRFPDAGSQQNNHHAENFGPASPKAIMDSVRKPGGMTNRYNGNSIAGRLAQEKPPMQTGVMLAALRQFGLSLLDLVLPKRCAGCQKTWLPSCGGNWCDACLGDLPWIESPFCSLCGHPFTSGSESQDHLCGDCLRSSFHFTSARSSIKYAGVIRERIHELKFGGQLHWIPALSELLVRTYERHQMPPVDFVSAVPLHKRRLRQRGFNQSALLAKAFARSLGIDVVLDIVSRQVWSVPQTRLKRDERLINVLGAFAVHDRGRVKNRSFLIIDDVYTTGSTLNECAKVLMKAGASSVHALTLARSIQN